MTAEGARNHPVTRIHAIVLTRNRPETLRRCIATALASLGPQDMLTILDDSLPTVSPINAALLAVTPTMPAPTRVHLSIPRAHAVITNSVSASALLWLSKTAPRDIAPLRNLSLLLSTAVPAETTILIDDDIHGFDLIATHRKFSVLAQSSRSLIVGADIGGINEMDTITRLTDAIDMLKKIPAGVKIESIRDLFHVRGSPSLCMGSNFRYVSAGYLAFQLPSERIFAFPPGYNEDWLWCLLHDGNANVQILRSGETVIHDPPLVRIPTREDVIFELVGDLVFDYLEEQNVGNYFDPQVALAGLLEWLPSPASMPSARALELVDKAQSLSQNGIFLPVLEEYGLAILRDMLRAGELEIDESRVLNTWCRDAIAKHKSVTATLQDEGTMPALKTLLQEWRL